MFSRSFKKSPQQIAQDIARRATPSRESVRRSGICSGEHNYTYTSDDFRIFQDQGFSNYAENLVKDFQEVYQKGNTALPYHAALTALHHDAATKSAANFLAQIRTIHHLVEMHNFPTPAPAPAPVPEPEPTCFAKARRQLAKMKFDLPPPHPKRVVVYRNPDGCDLSEINTNFDPEAFTSSARNTFVKMCCKSYNSVQECRCFKWCSRTSVNYINEKGEGIHVYYLERKTDYQNLTRSYPMCYQPDDEHIPHSPREDVSDSDLFPWNKDYDFEDECGNAYRAEQEGFTHVWSSKDAKRRHQRRQRRQRQRAYGELPEHGLIIVTLDIDEVWPIKTPLSLHAQHRHLQREKFEELQQYVRFYESWQEEHQCKPTPPPTPPSALLVPSPASTAPRFNTAGLCPFQIRRLIQHEKREHSMLYIQRPLTDVALIIAHAASRTQVTEISALKTHERTRLTGMAGLIAILAIRLGAAPGNCSMVATTLHHNAIQLILRRATGSEATVNQITAPYVKCCTKSLHGARGVRLAELREIMNKRFDRGVPKPTPPSAGFHRATFPEYNCGPIEFKKAKYYAEKCLELMGNPNDSASPSAAKWAHLRTQVKRVRRGEIEADDVYTSSENDNWVYAIHYTYVTGARLFLSAIEKWHTYYQPPRPDSSCLNYYWSNSTEIRADAPRYVQATLMAREMYRFMIKTHQILTPEFMSVFGLKSEYINKIITRTKHLACCDGDEASALMFGFMMPELMTPDIHIDICVEGQVFQHPDLYVKMSDPVFGPIKKQLRDMIPSRHTGVIDRATLMDEPRVRCRS